MSTNNLYRQRVRLIRQKKFLKSLSRVKKIFSSLAISSGLVAYFVFPALAAPTPISFANGSFEDGIPNIGSYKTLYAGDSTSIDNWRVTSGSVDYIGTYWKAADGSRSLDMSGNNEGAIAQTFSTVPGLSYTVTFDLSGNPAGEPTTKTLSVDAGSGTAITYNFNVTSNQSLQNMLWQPEKYNFTATSTSTTLTFTSETPSAWGPALDNVNVTPCTNLTTANGANLTAAVVDPSGTFSGTLDANGCDVGVYYGSQSGSIDNAKIYGAKEYGVFVDNGQTVNVSNSYIFKIGDTPPSGNQYGVGIYYTDGATGTVSVNTVSEYQKNGMAFTDEGTRVDATGNTVNGSGEVPNIAQNGIEFSYGASGSARGNTINGNWYTGSNWTSTGLLLFDVSANQVKTSNNKFMNNQRNLAVITAQSCSHQYGGFYQTYKLCPYLP